MQQNSRPIKYHGADLSVHYVLHYTLRRSLFNVPNVYSLAVLFRLNNQTKISQHFTAIRLVSGSLIGNLDTEIFLECQFRGKLQIKVEVLLPLQSNKRTTTTIAQTKPTEAQCSLNLLEMVLLLQ